MLTLQRSELMWSDLELQQVVYFPREEIRAMGVESSGHERSRQASKTRAPVAEGTECLLDGLSDDG